MTFEQGFQLCHQRRSLVEPIPAFCEQLKKYEKECRELGYLTAIDEQSDSKNSNYNGCSLGSSESLEKQRKASNESNHIETQIVGDKRKAEESADGFHKKRVVGPSIGPSIGPCRTTAATAIGPQRHPVKEQVDKKYPSERR